MCSSCTISGPFGGIVSHFVESVRLIDLERGVEDNFRRTLECKHLCTEIVISRLDEYNAARL